MLFEEEIRLDPDQRTFVDPGLAERGGYELTVTVDGGPEDTFQFSLEDHDFRMGSNLIVTGSDDDIGALIEE